MKTFIKVLILLCTLVSNVANAQSASSGFDFEIAYDPVLSYPVRLSTLTSVYADSQRIYTLGYSQKDTSNWTASRFVPVIEAYDYNGQRIWQKKLIFDSPYDNGQQHFFHLITRLSSSKLVIANTAWGCLPIIDTCYPKSYLYLFSNNGDSIRKVNMSDVLTESPSYHPRSLNVDNQKNILVAGIGYLQSTDEAYSFVLKYDSTGLFKWKKLFVSSALGTTIIKFNRMVSSSDGSGYLIAGVRDVLDTLQTGFYLSKLDTAGNVLWHRNLPKPTPIMQLTGSDDWIDIVPNRFGGGYYFMCSAAKNTEGGKGYYCGKLSEQGDTLWTKVYDIGGLNFGIDPYTLSQRSNGDLALNGSFLDYINTQGGSQTASSVLNLDTLGNVKWFKSYRYYNCVAGGVGSLYFKSYSTPYNGLVMAGYNGSYDSVPGCFPIIGSIARLTLADSLGRRNPTDTNYINIPITVLPFNPPVLSIKTAKQTLPFQCYPNPAQTEFTLDWDAAAAPNLYLRISDVLGKEVYKEEVKNGNAKVNVQTWSPGLYSIKLYKDSQLVGTASLVKR